MRLNAVLFNLDCKTFHTLLFSIAESITLSEDRNQCFCHFRTWSRIIRMAGSGIRADCAHCAT